MAYSTRQNPASTNNYTVGREGGKISEIIIHHAATTSFDGIGQTFSNPARGASAHYGVGQNNNVDQYVSENDTAWHANDWPHNLKSIGIENVNLTGAPDWLIDDSTFATLVELVTDIATRNHLLPLIVGKNLLGHKDVGDQPTSCPMALEPRLQELADKVNGSTTTEPTPEPALGPDQVLQIGSKIVFNGSFRVDDLQKINGIWQVRTNELCPDGFTWNDNGIPVDPLTEVAGGVGNSSDQVLQIGSNYKLPSTFTVLNLGQYKTYWLAEVEAAGWKFWVNVTPATEV